MSDKKLIRSPLLSYQQAILFQFIVEGKQWPEWAKDSRTMFARLMNQTQEWADKAYERAYNGGYLDKTK